MLMFCRICGNESGNGRECKRCIYFLDHGDDENSIRIMLSDGKTRKIWEENETIAEELARTYYDHVIENYNRKQVRQHSKENFGFNTFVDGIRLGLDIVMPMISEELKAQVDSKVKSMIQSRRLKGLRAKRIYKSGM